MRVCVVLCLLFGAAFGQSSDASPKFEVAEIHASPRTTQPIVRGPFFGASRYEVHYATMLDLVRFAYDVDPERVSGGPSWLEMNRYDVAAKLPGPSTKESRKLMLQDLLADRFKLVVHKDSKPIDAFALSVGKKPALKEADGEGEKGCKFTVENQPPNGPQQGPIQLPVLNITCKNMSMEAFAAGILDLPAAGQYFDNKVVVDKTGLKGEWNFNFKFTPKVPAGIKTVGENITLFDAVEKQLGLKLEPGSVPAPVIVVDSVNAKPTDNPPDVASHFPPVPTEFDVAEIKPAVPPPPGPNPNNQQRAQIKNGRIYIPGITLKNLVTVAWDINGDEMLINAPKWMDSDKFDVIAKAPANVALGELTQSRNAIPFNLDALRPMLQALIVERFKMKTHTEERPVNAYSLVAVKPKLKKADPTARTRWIEGIGSDSKDTKNANATLGRLVTCQNVSMAQFAEMLPGIAPGYLHTDVIDNTGLQGGYDFTFSFSPLGALQIAGGKGADSAPPSSDSMPEAADSNGALSLFDAMTRELGLKLEQHKRPTKVLVIDQIEQKPTDN
jgi:uncharacterized protein (TIGR03435 family)